jgi:methionyl-tRNA formyltransferase
VAGPDACSGVNHGLAITRVRTEDGSDHAAADYFRTMGGYLTPAPCPGEAAAAQAPNLAEPR